MIKWSKDMKTLSVLNISQDKINRILKSFHKFNKRKLIYLIVAIVRTVLIMGLSFLILYPIIIKLSTSLKDQPQLYDPQIFVVPKKLVLDNFYKVLNFIDYPKTLLYSVFLSVLSAVLQTLSCTMVAYGLARFKYWGKNIVFAMVLVTLVVPPQTVLLPLYMQFRYLGFSTLFQFGGVMNGFSVINTPLPFIILSFFGLGFKNGLFIYLLRQNFRNMPVALEEAAYIDGCSVYKTFSRIMLPNVVPMMITAFLFSFIWQWNDYFYSSILAPNLNILSLKIINIGWQIASLENQTYNYMVMILYNNAAFIIHMIPLIILFLFTQKFLVQSIERSGLVG